MRVWKFGIFIVQPSTLAWPKRLRWSA